MPQTLVETDLMLLNLRADETQSARYARLAFDVPEGCGKLTVSMDVNTELSAQIPMILFDSEQHVRLMRAANPAKGEAHTVYTLTPAKADKGCIPGPIPAGSWRLLLYKRRMYEDVLAHITISCEEACAMPAATQEESPAVRMLHEQPFSAQVPDSNPGWYCGELHTHSSESTGHTSLEAVVDTARRVGLDYIALTDHFTASHWLKLQEVSDGKRPLLLQSMEISGDFGHANVHGLHTWLNPLVDDNAELVDFLGLKGRPSMSSIADDAHEQGALMCINHALSGIMGWRYREFPFEKADLYEVHCTSEIQTCMLYTTHWDMLLTRGYHLTGVGSSDSHHPTLRGPWQLGHVRTWIYADELSQPALLRGLKAGHVYVGIEGARMEMCAACAGQSAMMGDTMAVSRGESFTVTMTMIDHPRGNLYLYSDGMQLDVIYYDQPGTDTYTLTYPESWIAPGGESYIRMEFHEAKEPPKFHGQAFRDYQSARLISNPIWFKRKENNTTC